MSVDEILAEVRRRYPDEPLLYSFRQHILVVIDGGMYAALAAVERHIEWKAKMQPFRDEIDRLNAEIQRLTPEPAGEPVQDGPQ